MKTFLKAFIVGTAPAFVITLPAIADGPATPPTTQPAATLAQSNTPLVIPDGTSPQNPGPQAPPNPSIFESVDGVRF